MTECDMIGHCYNPDDIEPRECGRCHEMEKELMEQAVSGGIEHEWQPIETAPSLTECFVYTDDWEIFAAYQNSLARWVAQDPAGGGQCFIGAKVTHWMPLPKPPGDLK